MPHGQSLLRFSSWLKVWGSGGGMLGRRPGLRRSAACSARRCDAPVSSEMLWLGETVPCVGGKACVVVEMSQCRETACRRRIEQTESL